MRNLSACTVIVTTDVRVFLAPKIQGRRYKAIWREWCENNSVHGDIASVVSDKPGIFRFVRCKALVVERGYRYSGAQETNCQIRTLNHIPYTKCTVVAQLAQNTRMITIAICMGKLLRALWQTPRLGRRHSSVEPLQYKLLHFPNKHSLYQKMQWRSSATTSWRQRRERRRVSGVRDSVSKEGSKRKECTINPKHSMGKDELRCTMDGKKGDCHPFCTYEYTRTEVAQG